MIAGEALDPRRTIPRAFRTITARLIIFFIGGSLCVGVSALPRFTGLVKRLRMLPPRFSFHIMMKCKPPASPSPEYLIQGLTRHIVLPAVPKPTPADPRSKHDPPFNSNQITHVIYSVISMERLRISVLPSIVTAALLTTVISAGNAYCFNASRSLHAMALEGQAPSFLRRLNKRYVFFKTI